MKEYILIIIKRGSTTINYAETFNNVDNLILKILNYSPNVASTINKSKLDITDASDMSFKYETDKETIHIWSGTMKSY